MSLDQRGYDHGYDPVARGKHYLFTALLSDWLRDFQATNQHAFHNKQSRREIPLVVLATELPARRQFTDHYIKMYFFLFKTSKQAWQPPKTFILKTKLCSYVGCRLLTRKCHRTFFQAFFARLAARLLRRLRLRQWQMQGFLGLKVEGGGLNLQIWDLNRAHETERTVFPILQVFSMCRRKL